MVTGVLGRGSVDVIVSFGDVIVGVMGTWSPMFQLEFQEVES